jgi:serine/threonine protein phosphatase PrpC
MKKDDVDAETAPENAVGKGNDVNTPSSPAAPPTKKIIARHESTLVALRPSTSPRSFPLSALQLAAEALKTPLPVSPFYEKLNLGPLVFGASQAKGMRPYMEDRHITEEPLIPRGSSGAPIPDNIPRSFAAVYDGHNGTLAADHAADRLHFILAAEPAFRTCTGDGPPAALHREDERITGALIHAFEATDKEILTRCRTENGRGGATGVVILRIGEMLYAAHCGDSRAVLCRSGEPLRLTEDHKPNLPRERKRVEDLGGRVDFARCWRVIVDPGGGRPASGLAVSRSFGDPDFKEPLHLVTATPDVMSERLTEEDSFVILASDGLWDVMTDKRACEIVKAKILTAMANASGGGEKVPLSFLAMVAAQALVQSALNAGTMDNVTAVVGLLKWS